LSPVKWNLELLYLKALKHSGRRGKHWIRSL